jgi:hypothetical protein
VVLVLGANDVVNPAAKTDPKSVMSYCQIWCLPGGARSGGKRLLSRCAVDHR